MKHDWSKLLLLFGLFVRLYCRQTVLFSLLVACLLALHPSNMLVYLSNASVQTSIHAIEVADHTFCLTQSQYIDTRPTSPSGGPIMPGTTGVPIFKSLA